MPHIAAADAPKFQLHQAEFTGLAAPSRGAAETAAWRVRIAPGSGPGVPHRLTREEILVALTGRATARIGDAEHDFAAGDAIVVPPFTDFSLSNTGGEPFEAIAILPAGARAMLADGSLFTPPWAA